MRPNESYLLEVAITIKCTFPKSSAKEVKCVLHSIFLRVGVCQLTEERSTSLEQKKDGIDTLVYVEEGKFPRTRATCLGTSTASSGSIGSSSAARSWSVSSSVW